MGKALIIDSNPVLVSSLSNLLSAIGHTVYTAGDLAQGQAQVLELLGHRAGLPFADQRVAAQGDQKDRFGRGHDHSLYIVCRNPQPQCA